MKHASISYCRGLEKTGGGTGVVCAAKETVLGRFVALKFLPVTKRTLFQLSTGFAFNLH
jgi:hypothetical protein